MSKLEEKEIKDLQDNQSKINQLINQIGFHYFQKMNARRTLKNLIKQSDTITKDQQNLFKDLENKYGKIEIDLPSGEFKKIETKSSE